MIDEKSLSEKYLINDLYQIILSSSSNPTKMMNKLSSILREFIGAREIILFQCSKNYKYGHRIISQIHEDENKRLNYLKFAEEIHEQSSEINSFNRESSNIIKNHLKVLGYNNMISVPIFTKNRRIGCLHQYGSIQNSMEKQIFRLLDSISPLIGVILENYELFNEMDSLLKEKTKTLSSQNKEMKSLVNTVPDLIITTDDQLNIKKIFNYNPERYYFKNIENNSNFNNFISNKNYNLKLHEINRLQSDNTAIFVEEVRFKDKVNYLENRIKKSGKEYLHIIRNITDEIEAEKTIEFMNQYDKLSGLLNRRMLYNDLEKSVKNDSNTVILLVDILGLKLINETLGFSIGDKYIKNLSNICKLVSPNNSEIYRVGDDEIAFLMQDKTNEDVNRIIENIKLKINELNKKQKNRFPLNISYGYHICREKDIAFEKVYNIAVNNLNQDKLLNSESNKSALVKTLTKALEERDFITEGHADRMEKLMNKFGIKLKMSSTELNNLRLFAKFHDIGKVGVSDKILFKPDKLNEYEMKQMKKHSEIGYRIATSSPELHSIADFILKHHERYDGSGYPIGLKGNDIPLECRILAIVDAYDAMTNDRPYRKAYCKEKVVKELIENKETQFDPKLVDVFLSYLLK